MIGTIISGFIIVIIEFYIWRILSDNSFKLLRIKSILYILITTLLVLFNFYIINTLGKIINITICFIIIYKLYFKCNYKEAIVCPIFSQFIFVLSELIISLFMLILLKDDVDKYVNNYAGNFSMNILISLLALLIVFLPFTKKIYCKTINYVSNIKDDILLFILLSGIIIYSVSSFNLYYGIDKKYTVLIVLLLISVSYSLIFLFFESKYKYYKLIDRYNKDLAGFKEIEKVLDNYRIVNHENKNRLMTIRNMTKSKKIINYIDHELNNTLVDNKVLYREVSDVPGKGLRGIIYSKLLIIKSFNLEYELNVAPSIRLLDINEIDDNTMYDIIKLLGIYIDNAIEEERKNDYGYVIIEMYTEKSDIIISVTNTLNKTIDAEKMFNKRYTTKGKNHGYGLALANLIIENNKKIDNHVEVGLHEITQKIIIKKVYKMSKRNK